MDDERLDDDQQGSGPSDDDELVGDTASSKPLTDKHGVQPGDAASREENGTLVPRGTRPPSAGGNGEAATSRS